MSRTLRRRPGRRSAAAQRTTRILPRVRLAAGVAVLLWSAPAVAFSAALSAEQDQRRLLDLLHIERQRSGADGRDLIALCAPRPVFVSVGNPQADAWTDPRGMFLAAAAAGPVKPKQSRPGSPERRRIGPP
jgi:hypothetical protein